MGILDTLFAPSPDKFAKMVVAALKDAGDQREAIYEKMDFQLRFIEGGQETGIASLHNVYGEYCKAQKSDRKGQFSTLSGRCCPT